MLEGSIGFLLGRVVDALGVAIDGKGALSTTKQRHVEVKAPRLLVCHW